MMRNCSKAAADEGGATAIEYGLIAGAVALALLTAYWTVGDSLRSGLDEIAGALAVETADEGRRGIAFGTSRERD